MKLSLKSFPCNCFLVSKFKRLHILLGLFCQGLKVSIKVFYGFSPTCNPFYWHEEFYANREFSYKFEFFFESHTFFECGDCF